MASYPYELTQDAAYQSHTSRLTELWYLPRPAQGLNTNNNNNNNNNNVLLIWKEINNQQQYSKIPTTLSVKNFSVIGCFTI